MEQQTTSAPEAQGVTPVTPVKKVDTHSYKGWLNSDSFWKRVFSVYGYSLVGGIIIAIPLTIVIMLVAFGSAMLFLGGMHDSGFDRYRDANEYGSGYRVDMMGDEMPAGKIDINAVCEEALAFMTFPDGNATNEFLMNCKAGKHPEVIEQWKANMQVDGAVM